MKRRISQGHIKRHRLKSWLTRSRRGTVRPFSILDRRICLLVGHSFLGPPKFIPVKSGLLSITRRAPSARMIIRAESLPGWVVLSRALSLKVPMPRSFHSPEKWNSLALQENTVYSSSSPVSTVHRHVSKPSVKQGMDTYWSARRNARLSSRPRRCECPPHPHPHRFLPRHPGVLQRRAAWPWIRRK